MARFNKDSVTQLYFGKVLDRVLSWVFIFKTFVMQMIFCRVKKYHVSSSFCEVSLRNKV